MLMVSFFFRYLLMLVLKFVEEFLFLLGCFSSSVFFLQDSFGNFLIIGC